MKNTINLNSILKDIQESYNTMNSIYYKLTKEYKLNYNSLQVLRLIYNKEVFNQKDICEMLKLPKTTVNGIVKSFEKDKIIEIKSSLVDKRERNLSLTKKGISKYEYIINRIDDLELEVGKSIKIENLKNMSQILSQFVTSYDEKVEIEVEKEDFEK